MISISASCISPAAAWLPIASPSAKLCSPMPIAMSRASWVAGLRQPVAMVPAAGIALGPAAHPAVEVDQAEQAQAGADGEDRAVAQRRTVRVGGERRLDRCPRVCQDVPEQEHENADGQRVEQRADPGHRRAHPADRQADEDRESGDGPEQGDPGGRHARGSSSSTTTLPA
jgi:hypothetical protein